MLCGNCLFACKLTCVERRFFIPLLWQHVLSAGVFIGCVHDLLRMLS